VGTRLPTQEEVTVAKAWDAQAVAYLMTTMMPKLETLSDLAEYKTAVEEAADEARHEVVQLHDARGVTLGVLEARRLKLFMPTGVATIAADLRDSIALTVQKWVARSWPTILSEQIDPILLITCTMEAMAAEAQEVIDEHEKRIKDTDRGPGSPRASSSPAKDHTTAQSHPWFS
jgi:hypothetical protein